MKDTIHRIISDVLRIAGRPMFPNEIYAAISQENLYFFKAQNPLHIVKSQLRRHCKELNFPSARAMKYFTMTSDGRFQLLDRPVRVSPDLYKITSKSSRGKRATLVTVPTDEEVDYDCGPPQTERTHWEIQWRLLDLGSRLV